MAFGTESIAPVDVIVGPGNRYVAEAKRQVSGVVGVPSAFAGPSEVVVVADATPPPELAAIDLVVQAEHGPDGLAWLVTWSERVADGSTGRGRAPGGCARPGAADLEATLATGGLRRAGRRAGPGARRGQRRCPRAPRAPGGRRRRLCAAGQGGRRRVPRSVVAGQRGRLRGRAQPRAADQPDGPVRLGAPGRRLPPPHPRRLRRRARRSTELGPHVVTLAETEGLPPTPSRSEAALRRDRASRAGCRRIRPGPGRAGRVPLAAGRGRCAAQHQRVAPPRRPSVARGTPRRASAHRLQPVPRPSGRPSSRQALAESHGVRPEQVFCANGSNEVLQCLLLAYGGPGRTAAALRAHLRAAPPHRHAHRHRWSQGARADDSPIDPEVVDRVLTTTQPVITFLCSPNNPTGGPSPEAGRARAGPAPGLVVVDEAYGQFAPSSRARAGARRGPGHRSAGRGPDLLQDMVDGRRPARVPGGRPRRWWPPASWSSAVPPRRASPRLAGRLALRYDGADGGPGGHAREERGRSRLPWPSWRRDMAVGRQLHPLPAAVRQPARSGRTSSTVGPRAGLFGAGRGSTAACGSPSGTPRGERPVPGRPARRVPQRDAT